MNDKSMVRVERGVIPFAMINLAILENATLSWKAKGILAYCLSRPDNWTINLTDLIRRSPDGSAAVRSALEELELAGYMVRIEVREKGRFSRYDIVVYSEPMPEEKRSSPDQRRKKRKAKVENLPWGEPLELSSWDNTSAEPDFDPNYIPETPPEPEMNASPYCGFPQSENPQAEKPQAENRKHNYINKSIREEEGEEKTPARETLPSKPLTPETPPENPQGNQIVGKIAKMYEQEIGMITPFVREDILDLIKTCDDPERWEAVFRASVGKGYRWGWIKKCIQNPEAGNLARAPQPATAGQQRGKAPASVQAPPAVAIINEIYSPQRLPEYQYENVAGFTDLDLLRCILQAGKLLGWKGDNIAWMRDYYNRKEIPAVKKQESKKPAIVAPVGQTFR